MIPLVLQNDFQVLANGRADRDSLQVLSTGRRVGEDGVRDVVITRVDVFLSQRRLKVG